MKNNTDKTSLGERITFWVILILFVIYLGFTITNLFNNLN
jgi:hypothetical protein